MNASFVAPGDFIVKPAEDGGFIVTVYSSDNAEPKLYVARGPNELLKVLKRAIVTSRLQCDRTSTLGPTP